MAEEQQLSPDDQETLNWIAHWYDQEVADHCLAVAHETGQKIATAGVLDEALRRKNPKTYDAGWQAGMQPFNSD